jgi:hypothetical protein
MMNVKLRQYLRGSCLRAKNEESCDSQERSGGSYEHPRRAVIEETPSMS